MCETIKPSSWDQGGILRDIFTITRTIDDSIDSALEHPCKKKHKNPRGNKDGQ